MLPVTCTIATDPTTSGPAGRVRHDDARAVALGVLGALAYAFVTLCARGALRSGADVAAMLELRFLTTGLVLLGVLAVMRRPVLPAPGERLRVIALGAVTFAVESMCYFEALRRGTVAGVAPLFYAHVAIVAVVDIVLRVIRASLKVAVAVVFAVVGGVVIGLSGGPASVQPTGVVFALASATVYALYAIGSGRLVQRTDPITTAAWVAFGAAGGIGVWAVARGGLGTLPSGAVGWIVATGASTAAAFVLWFVVVARLGSARTAIIMILEAPMGIVLTSFAFGDPVSVAILLGGGLVLAGAVLAALETPVETVALEAATAP